MQQMKEIEKIVKKQEESFGKMQTIIDDLKNTSKTDKSSNVKEEIDQIRGTAKNIESKVKIQEMEGKQIEDKIKIQEHLILEIKTSLKDTDGKIAELQQRTQKDDMA